MKKTRFGFGKKKAFLLILLLAAWLYFHTQRSELPMPSSYDRLAAGLNSSYADCLNLCTNPKFSLTDMCAGILYRKTAYYNWKEAYDLNKKAGGSACIMNASYPDECSALESRFLTGLCLTEADIGKTADFCRQTGEPLAKDFCTVIKLREDIGYYPINDSGLIACESIANEAIKSYCVEAYRRKE